METQEMRNGGAARNGSGESLAERGAPVAAMLGAVGGALGGAVLGAEAGSALPAVCGTIGTMLGGAVAAVGWCLSVRLWAGRAGRGAAWASGAAPERAVSPVPSAG